MNAQVIGTGQNLDFTGLIVAVAILGTVYFVVFPLTVCLVAGWRLVQRHPWMPSTVGCLWGLAIALGLAVVLAPWCYLPGAHWFAFAIPWIIAIACPALLRWGFRWSASRL